MAINCHYYFEQMLSVRLFKNKTQRCQASILPFNP
jgi:hypothetical protein